MAASTRKILTLIVPCLNESGALDTFLVRCEAVADTCPAHGFEYLFVDDGSTDCTWQKIQSLSAANPRVRGLRLARNYGQQRAISAGLDVCDSDYVAILDADLQDPPELLPALLAQLDGGFDLVHAVREDRSSDAWFKRWSARVFYFVMRRWVLPDLPENAGDFKAFNRAVLTAIRAYRENVRFLRGLFATIGFRQTTVSYTRPPRHSGLSKYPLGMMLRLARDAIFSNTALPLRWCLYTGGAALLVSPFLFVYAALHADHEILYLFIAAQWMFSSLVLLALGFAGEYLKVLVLETKHRPLYLIRERVNVSTGSRDCG